MGPESSGVDKWNIVVDSSANIQLMPIFIHASSVNTLLVSQPPITDHLCVN